MSITMPGIAIEALPRAVTVDPPLTDAEFEALCFTADNIQLERTRDGVIHMHSPALLLTGDGNAEIIRQLRNWWHTHRRGRVFDSNTGFFLPDSSMLSPDAGYVGPAKLEGLTPEDYEHFLRLCPDFVIELRSRSDSLAKVKRKMELWMENGAALGWLVNPDTRTVYCYQPDARGIAFAGKALSGTGPVEGFVLDLEEVWRCYEV